MPNRYTGGSDYRYGYNDGSEMDDEITGVEGAHITTYFREIDTRLGRMWSRDPVTQSWQSSYTSMDNNPMNGNDPRGDAFWHSKARRQAIAKKQEFKQDGATNVKVFSRTDEQGYKNWYAQGGIDHGVVSSIDYREKIKSDAPSVEVSAKPNKYRVSVRQEVGLLKWKDKGVTGFEITGPSVKVSEFDIINNDNANTNTLKSDYLIFRDGVKGTIVGVKAESSKGDIKASINYDTHIKSAMGHPYVATNTSASGALGAPYVELKGAYDDYNISITTGFQEDVGKSFNYYIFGYGIKLNAEWKSGLDIKINWLENWLESK